MANVRLNDSQQKLLETLQAQLRINIEQGHSRENMFNLAVAFGEFRANTVPEECRRNWGEANKPRAYAYCGIWNYSHNSLKSFWNYNNQTIYDITWPYALLDKSISHNRDALNYDNDSFYTELIENVKNELFTYVIYPSLLSSVMSARAKLQSTLDDYKAHLTKDIEKETSAEKKETHRPMLAHDTRRAMLARDKVNIVDELLATLPTEASLVKSETKGNPKERIKNSFSAFATTLATKTNELTQVRRNGTCTDSDCTMTVLKVLGVILTGIIPGLLIGAALTRCGVFKTTGANTIDAMNTTLGKFNDTVSSSLDDGPLLKAKLV